MKNVITLQNLDGSPATGKSVEAYEYDAAPPYYGDKIGDYSEVPGLGEYYIEITSTVKATILVNSAVQSAFVGYPLLGDLGPGFIPDDSITTIKIDDGAVTTAKLADGSVTPIKTTFAEDH